MIRIILVSAIILSLVGCSHLNSDFECPMKGGVRCESLDQVNAKVDRGEIGQDKLISLANNISPDQTMTAFEDEKPHPLRFGETVQRLWISPYEDSSGNYHKVSEIFVITKSGHWLLNPLKEIREDN